MLLETLPHYWTNVQGWLISEKLDGWRCLWTSEMVDGWRGPNTLRTRHGKILDAPEWFLAGLPAGAQLDGELFHSREGGHNAVASAIKRGDWTGLRFHAFDAPAHFGCFTNRLGYVERAIAGTAAVMIPHAHVASYAAAREFARSVFHSGGEGAVVRNPDGIYRGGRSWDALKIKPGEGLAA